MISIAKPYFSSEETLAVQAVLSSGVITQGPVTKEFETAFAKVTQSSYAIAVNTGTAAVHTALYAAGIGPGDEVITTPYTFIGTVNPILMVGATPVFVDITYDDFNIDSNKIEAAISPKTKAILTVDLFGQLCDYKAILAIAKKHNLLVIQDACQAIGACSEDGVAGNLGDISVFSLYATKNITTGEGGVVTTNNETFALKSSQFRNHSMTGIKDYDFVDIGYNYRFHDVAAAVGIVQLKKLDEITEKRRSNANLYNNFLKEIPGLVLPQEVRSNRHTYSQYCIRVTDDFPLSRDELQKVLYKHDIQTKIYYPKPLYHYEHIERVTGRQNFDVAEQASKEILALPVHPGVSQTDIQTIARIIISAARS